VKRKITGTGGDQMKEEDANEKLNYFGYIYISFGCITKINYIMLIT
jgi:hypothetical protein